MFGTHLWRATRVGGSCGGSGRSGASATASFRKSSVGSAATAAFLRAQILEFQGGAQDPSWSTCALDTCGLVWLGLCGRRPSITHCNVQHANSQVARGDGVGVVLLRHGVRAPAQAAQKQLQRPACRRRQSVKCRARQEA